VEAGHAERIAQYQNSPVPVPVRFRFFLYLNRIFPYEGGLKQGSKCPQAKSPGGLALRQYAATVLG
jgi:hypothetical protein